MAPGMRDRDADRSSDVAVLWFGHGVELAQRLEAFIADHRARPVLDDPGRLLEDLDALLHADFGPNTDPLFNPPTLRPAVPPATTERTS